MRRWLTRVCCLILCLVLAPSGWAQSDAAHQQFLFAYRLLERQDAQMAADAFDDYLNTYRGDAKYGDACYYRALLHRQAGQPDLGIGLLEIAPEPTLVDGWRLRLLLGQLYYDAGRFDRSAAALGSIDTTGLDETASVTVSYHLGRAYLQAGNATASAHFLEEATRTDTVLRPRALFELGQAQLQSGQSDDAEAAWRDAVETGDPTVAPAAAQTLGALIQQQGRTEEAMALYRTILDEHPDSPRAGPAIVAILSLQTQAGDSEAVIETYEARSATLTETHAPSAAYLAGSAYLAVGEFETARETFSSIADLDAAYPPGDAVLYQLASTEFRLHRYEALDRTVAQLAERFPHSPRRIDATFLQAAADAQRGRVEPGLDRLTQIIDLGADQPYYAPALLQRANLAAEHDLADEAMDDYLAYFEHSPVLNQNPTAEQTGAMLRLLHLGHQLGRFELVRGLALGWVQTMRLEPEVAQDLLYRLGLAAWSARDYDAARQAFAQLDERHPDHPHQAAVTYYQGRLAILDGQTDEGVAQVRQAVAMQGLPHQLVVEAFRIEQAYHLDRDEPELAAHALAQLEQVVTLDGLTETDLIWLARHQLETGDPASAERYLLELLQDRPDLEPRVRARAMHLAGLTERRLGQPSLAADWFEQVVALNAGWELEASIELAGCRVELGEYDEAIRLYGPLVSAGVSRVEARALYEMADAHLLLDDPDAARTRLTRLIVLYPDASLEPYPHLGYLKLAALATDSRRTLMELVETFPDTPYALYAQAQMADDRQEALDLLNQIQTDEPELRERVENLRRSLTQDTDE